MLYTLVVKKTYITYIITTSEAAGQRPHARVINARTARCPAARAPRLNTPLREHCSGAGALSISL